MLTFVILLSRLSGFLITPESGHAMLGPHIWVTNAVVLLIGLTLFWLYFRLASLAMDRNLAILAATVERDAPLVQHDLRRDGNHSRVATAHYPSDCSSRSVSRSGIFLHANAWRGLVRCTWHLLIVGALPIQGRMGNAHKIRRRLDRCVHGSRSHAQRPLSNHRRTLQTLVRSAALVIYVLAPLTYLSGLFRIVRFPPFPSALRQSRSVVSSFWSWLERGCLSRCFLVQAG